MTEAVQLKPCPLCASDDVILHQVTKDGGWGVLCRTCHTYQDTRTDRSTAIAVWNRRPNPSVDADVREKIVLELVEMHKLAIAVANAKRHGGIGSFGAEEGLCQAAFSLRLGNAMLNAAVEIERLALTGNASTDTEGTQACKAEVSPDLPTDWSEKMAGAPQGGGEVTDLIVRSQRVVRSMGAEFIPDPEKIAALKPQTPDVLGEAGWVEWHGGADPFPGKSVAIKLRCGIISSSGPGLYRWRHYGQPTPSDIVAYRATPPGDVLGGEGEGCPRCNGDCSDARHKPSSRTDVILTWSRNGKFKATHWMPLPAPPQPPKED